MNVDALEKACETARLLAKDNPGKYGGRYVVRMGNGDFAVLEHDDPNRFHDEEDEETDLYAHVRGDSGKVVPLGRAKAFLRQDGTVVKGYFKD